jgi:CHAD domain-containing protein
VSTVELEYLAPAEFDLRVVGDHLPAPLHVDGGQSQSGERAFYDTFDGRLSGNQLRLIHENGFLRLFASGGREIGAVASPSAPEMIRPNELEAGALRTSLAAACDVRTLLRAARVRSDRHVLPVLDDEGKTVARLVSEDAVVVGAGDADDRLRPRLRLVAVRGYDKAARRIREVLEDELGLAPVGEPLEDEAITRSGGSPTGVSSSVEVELAPDLPAERAAVALSLRLLDVIQSNLPGTIADLDIEFLHDLRVAVRRTRALQRELKKVFPPGQLAKFRAEFKWVQRVTGPSRDLDVYLLEFDQFAEELPEPQRSHLTLLRTLLRERRASERVQMEQALRSERGGTLFADWREFLERLPGKPAHNRPSAATAIGEVAAHRIQRVYRQMVRMGLEIDDGSPAEALHDLRKKGKELRYLLEFFAPLFPSAVTKPMVKTLKSLQDTLGRFQDREVQSHMIRGLGSEIAARPGGAEALMAIGVLVERLEEHQRDARAEFSERFAAFSASDQRELVKKTFG